jgi:hypothetical protein
VNSTVDRLRQRTVVALTLLLLAVATYPPGAVLSAAPNDRTTNYGCGYLNAKDFRPVWIPNGNSFHVMGWQGLDLASGGDSCGPVFINNEALGTISGETIHFRLTSPARAVRSMGQSTASRAGSALGF